MSFVSMKSRDGRLCVGSSLNGRCFPNFFKLCRCHERLLKFCYGRIFTVFKICQHCVNIVSMAFPCLRIVPSMI